MAFNLSAGGCKQKAIIHKAYYQMNWNFPLKSHHFSLLQNFVPQFATQGNAAYCEELCVENQKKLVLNNPT